MYDGPFCVLSIVDNRTFRRLTYEVLDRDPTQSDVESLFRTFQAALRKRGLTLRGVVAVPEPLGLFLAVGGLGAFAMTLRRRRRASLNVF